MRWIALLLVLLSITTGCATHRKTVTLKVTKDWTSPQTTIEGTRAELQINVEI